MVAAPLQLAVAVAVAVALLGKILEALRPVQG